MVNPLFLYIAIGCFVAGGVGLFLAFREAKKDGGFFIITVTRTRLPNKACTRTGGILSVILNWFRQKPTSR